MGKGQNFERTICKKLSLWWTGDKQNDVFWRTAGSGARATVRMKKNECTALSAGDLGCIDPIGAHFINNCLVEIKRGYTDKYKIKTNKKTGKQTISKSSTGIDILAVIDAPKTQKLPIFIEWWIKAEQERKQHNRKFTFVIFKRDRKQECIAISKDTFQKLVKNNDTPSTDASVLVIIHQKCDIVLMTLDYFLSWCSPDYFNRKTFLKRRIK